MANGDRPTQAMIKKFTCSMVSQAPKSPGLYAWYGRVDIGESDYLRSITDGKDLGEDRFRSLLARHTQRFNLPDMRVRITSSFESEWRATCSECTEEGFLEVLLGQASEPDQTEQDDKETKRRIADLEKTLAKQRHRQILKGVLELSLPVFASPIYIGVTDDLRRRLGEHVALLERFASAIKQDPNQRERLRQSTNSEFAVRAIAAGFDENYLEVHVLDFTELESAGQSPAELRDIAGAAEWLLNRWHKPYLGRR
jgi:hypothetical protein